MIRYLVIGILTLSVTFCTPLSDVSNEPIRKRVQRLSAGGKNEGLHCIVTLKKVYAYHRYRPIWTDPERIDEWLSEIARADLHGLIPEDYHLETLFEYQIKENKTAFDRIRFDLLLTDGCLLYMTHLLSGKVDPLTIDAQWHVSEREGDPYEIFISTILKQNKRVQFDRLHPQHAAYGQLKDFLKRYRSYNGDAWQQRLTEKKGGLREGDKDDSIPIIRKRLKILGDLGERGLKPKLPLLSKRRFDQTLNQAMIRFKKRHGLKENGIIDGETIRALNISPEKRAEQILVNLERYRWLPRNLGEYYILVNIADFSLDVFKNDALIHTQKIIVGKPYRKTPVFSSTIYYMIFNPTWTIPMSIVRSEIIPNAKKDKHYLRKQNIVLLNSHGKVKDPEKIDLNTIRLNHYLFRQASGPVNSMGRVKFMLPNLHDIYLHDTPDKRLFNHAVRAYSSGCIRLHQPIDLALVLLSDQSEWTIESIRNLIDSGVTRKVMLRERPQIHLVYFSAWVDKRERLHFRPDIYKRDVPLLKALLDK